MSAPNNQPNESPNRTNQPPQEPQPWPTPPRLPPTPVNWDTTPYHALFFNTIERISKLNANELDGDLGYNVIHPLFSRARFVDLTDAQYEVMRRPCRLASEFLFTMPAILMMYDMMNFACDKVGIAPATRKEMLVLRQHPRPEHGEPPSDHTMSAVTQGLLALSNHLEIRIQSQSSFGSTGMRGPSLHDQPAWDGANFHPVIGSNISISSEAFDLLKGYKDARESGTSYRTAHEVFRIFEMAVLLIHETGHAVWNATGCKMWCTRPNLGYAEPFYGPDGVTSEIGFELTSQIFGGVITLQRFGGLGDDVAWYGNSTSAFAIGGKQALICLSLPPARSTWKAYAAAGAPFEVRRPLPVVEKVCRVRFTDIHRFFTKGFWEVCDEDGLGGRTQDLFDLRDEAITDIDAVNRDTRFGPSFDVVGVEQPNMDDLWTKDYPE